MLISDAFAQAAPAGGGGGDFFLQLVPLFMIIAIMYFLVLRPQQQKIKAHQAMVSAVKRGDVIVTGGGIVGKVVKVMENDEVLVEIAEEVRVRIIKGTINDVRSKTEPASVEAKVKADDEKK